MKYITKEAAQKCLDDLSSDNLIGNENDTFISLAEAKDRIEELPTADVVPKSEVEEEVVGYIERHLQYQRKKVDVPFTSRDMRNYQCGAIDVIEYFEELLAEIKKKYTGGGTECQ